jgi:hypothetical protein
LSEIQNRLSARNAVEHLWVVEIFATSTYERKIEEGTHQEIKNGTEM